MPVLLEIKNLKKTFGLPKQFVPGTPRVRAVDGVDLSVLQGEHLGLVGESGSGKSTLARLILKLYPADSGEILWEGQKIAELSQAAFRPFRSYVQMVFQDPYSSLDPRFTVRQILREAMSLFSQRKTRDEQHDYMGRMLKKVGLDEDALPRFPHEFSGGERQRIAIARALIMRPKLLILDEAVSALDVLIQEQIIALLHDLQREFGLTYLFITHNLRIVRRLCHRIAVMYQGRIVEVAATQDLFAEPFHPYTRQLLDAALHYKIPEQARDIYVDKNSYLIDKGNRHFVIN